MLTKLEPDAKRNHQQGRYPCALNVSDANKGKKRKPEVGTKMVYDISPPETYWELYSGHKRKVAYYAD